MEGILKGGHFSPPTPKLRVGEGRTREQSVYNFIFYFWNIAVLKAGRGQYRHVTRPVTAEDGRMENPWFGRLRKQASN